MSPKSEGASVQLVETGGVVLKKRGKLTPEEKQARHQEIRDRSVERKAASEAKKSEIDRKSFASSYASLLAELGEAKPNKRRIVKLSKSCGALVGKHPEFISEFGVNEDLLKRERKEVRKYGCVGRALLVRDDGQVVPGGETITIEDIMRAKHEYYNMAHEALAPLRRKALSLLVGPRWEEAMVVQRRLDNIQEERNKLNFRVVQENKKGGKADQGVVSSLKTSIDGLEAEMSRIYEEEVKPLRKALSEERRANRKLYSREIKDLTVKGSGSSFSKVMNALRARIGPAASKTSSGPCFVTSGGIQFPLFASDYDEVEAAVLQSIEASLDAEWVNQAETHFRYETKEGGRPENLISYDRWDREGSFRVTLKSTTVEDLYGKRSDYVRVRPLTTDDLSRHRLSPALFDKETTRQQRIAKLAVHESDRRQRIVNLSAVAVRDEASEKELVRLRNQEVELTRLRAASARGEGHSDFYLVQMRVGNTRMNLWWAVPVKLHRPISDDGGDQVTVVTFQTKKIGLRHVNEVLFTVSQPVLPAKETGGTVHIRTCTTQRNGGILVAVVKGAHEKHPVLGEGTSEIVIPSKIVDRFDDSKRVFGYIKEHYRLAEAKLSELNLVHPTIGGDLKWDSRSEIRFAFREWLKYLQGTLGRQALNLKIKPIFRKIREAHAESKGYGTYAGAYDPTWAMVTSELRSAFQMKRSEAEVLAVLMLFVERYDHLYPMATSFRVVSERHRREIYRTVSARLAATYGNIVFTQSSDTSFVGKAQDKIDREICISSLMESLKNAARKTGTRSNIK